MNEEQQEQRARAGLEVMSRRSKWDRIRLELDKSRQDCVPAHEEVDLAQEQPELPKMDTGIENAKGERLQLQGLSLIAAESGTGKSVVATSIALCAARNGWLSILHDCENDAGLTRKRIRRWYGSHCFEKDFRPVSRRSFRYFPAFPGQTWNQIIGSTIDAVGAGQGCTEGLFVVIDSLQAFARNLDERNQFVSANRIMRWANHITRKTEGQVLVLVLSETNTAGGVYGATPVFTSNVSLKLLNDPERGEDAVTIEVLKQRDGRSRYTFGQFLRNWQQNCLILDEWNAKPEE